MDYQNQYHVNSAGAALGGRDQLMNASEMRTISKHNTVRSTLEKLMSEVELLMRAVEEHRQMLEPVLVPEPPQVEKEYRGTPTEPMSETVNGIMVATERVQHARTALQRLTARAHV